MKTEPRIAFFTDSYTEVNGVAHTSRMLADFAKRRELPFLCVHAASGEGVTGRWGDGVMISEEGSLMKLALPRTRFGFRLDADLRFDLLMMRHARLALETVQTVNLSMLATAFSGHAQEESNYKRLQRFLRSFTMPYAEVVAFVVKLPGVPAPYTLALDRTNWQVGTVDLNILMLSIVYRGIGFPVVWIVLPKAGNSDTTERETVLEIFLDLFGAPNIACLLGDREFVGKQWFRFLKQHRIKFQMRRVPPPTRRISNPGFARILRSSGQAIPEALGSRDALRSLEITGLQS